MAISNSMLSNRDYSFHFKAFSGPRGVHGLARRLIGTQMECGDNAVKFQIERSDSNPSLTSWWASIEHETSANEECSNSANGDDVSSGSSPDLCRRLGARTA